MNLKLKGHGTQNNLNGDFEQGKTVSPLLLEPRVDLHWRVRFYVSIVGLITASVGCWLVNARPGKSVHPPTTDVR
jgi:hypothetical protein